MNIFFGIFWFFRVFVRQWYFEINIGLEVKSFDIDFINYLF